MTAPLRRVIGKMWIPKVTNGIAHMALYEALECGHWQLKKSDWFGPYTAQRRRCLACAMQKVK